jgi:hypothetical protein
LIGERNIETYGWGFGDSEERIELYET